MTVLYKQKQEVGAEPVGVSPIEVFKGVASNFTYDVFNDRRVTVLASKRHQIQPLNAASGVSPVRRIHGTIYKSFGQGVNYVYNRDLNTGKNFSYCFGVIYDRSFVPTEVTMSHMCEVKYRDS